MTLDLTGVSYVYFDLDDTLLDHRHAEQAALRELVAEFPAAFGEDDIETILPAYHAVNSRVWAEYSDGTRTKSGAKYGRFKLLLEHLPGADPTAANHLGDMYLERYETHWTWIEGALEAFTHTAKHLPVGLLTNGFSEVQRRKLARFDALERLASHVVISEEVGVLKPDPALFHHAAQVAGVSSADMLYVGDSKRSDVDGGLGAGWRVAWFRGQDHTSDRVGSFHDWRDFTMLW